MEYGFVKEVKGPIVDVWFVENLPLINTALKIKCRKFTIN